MIQTNVAGAALNLVNLNSSPWNKRETLERYLKKYTKLYNIAPGAVKKAMEQGEIAFAQKDEEQFITTLAIKEMELEIAKNVLRIMNAPATMNFNDKYINKVIDFLEHKKGVKLHENQRMAVIKAVHSQFMVLTGGPGTGKTFVLNFIKDVHKELEKGYLILFSAPSAKASKRITESIGEIATTTHKMLGITPLNTNPTPIHKNVKMVVCDEVSMLDMTIFLSLVKAIRTGCKLILVGDTDQLPSVSYGAILRDLIASQVVPVAQLTKTFRQAGDSILFDNIMRIKNCDHRLIAGDDFNLATIPKGYTTKDILLWMYQKQLEKWDTKDILCLTPFRKRETGSDCLNIDIQKMVNRTGPYVTAPSGMIFRKGDPVMQLDNVDSFSNGEVGFVSNVFNGCIQVYYPEQEKETGYDQRNIREITLAYAMTIHKSQGSEAPSVIGLMCKEHKDMASRNLLYTGVTRAKSEFSLLYDSETIKLAVATDGIANRYSFLAEILRFGQQQYLKTRR